ncbi:MAG: alpha amylase C-terminal domain-containing protein, partial [Clostridiales bacterium]|nr:alpha amylase C-terminal domain-containing protein [Clostridiales bacterium]
SSPGCYNSSDCMWSHPVRENGCEGWRFRVWAPAAQGVSVIGDFNGWQPESHPMVREPGGLWSLFIPGLALYDRYQYAIHTAEGSLLKKADPYAFHAETRPGTASKLYDLEGYQWGDKGWLRYRDQRVQDGKTAPINLYEVHLGSWRRTGDGQVLNYRTIAEYLVPYVKEMGFTGVKFLPVAEHPLDESLGYQLTGYYAVTSRFGTPTDFMYLVDQLHQAGVSVVLDGVSTGFPKDHFALYQFDGTPCYGMPDPAPALKTEEQKDMLPRYREGTQAGRSPKFSLTPIESEEELASRVCEFDLAKPEVENFLIAAAFFWLEKYHVDGFHFTGTPTEAAGFISHMNQVIHERFPYVTTYAGEPQELTGFDHCWNTEWVEKMLARLTDPVQTCSIFSVAKRPSSNSVLPLSHDLFAAPRPSLAARMQGDDHTQFAQVRAFYLFFLTQPGSKLTMMGTEFGQRNSWNCLQSLDWHLLQYDTYQKQQRFFREANNFYLSTPALWERDADESFRVVKTGARDQLMVYVRQGHDGCDYYVAANFSATQEQARHRISIPCGGAYEVVFSTDDVAYGGQGQIARTQGMRSVQSCGPGGSGLLLTLPPMTAVVLRCVHRRPERAQPHFHHRPATQL